MTHNLVFTLASLQRYLEVAPSDSRDPSQLPNDGSLSVIALATDETIFVVHRDDQIADRRVVILAQPMIDGLAKSALQRIHRVALADKLPIRLPSAWAEYHVDNRIAFFAWPPKAGPSAVRWVAEIGPDGSSDVCFWQLTDPASSISLHEYEPPYGTYRAIVAEWPLVLSQATGRFPAVDTGPHGVQAAVDLDVATFGAVTKYRTYSSWLPSLTAKQREFVEWSPDRAVKLRGPAGSGKTLALEIKALRELYRAREEGRAVRILFATHSWAMAEQVDSALRSLDESGDISPVDILPLLELARIEQQPERHAGRLLGDDSLTGRREQLGRLSAVLERAVKGDWLAYRRQASPEFQARVGAQVGSPEWNGLLWDLMLEFSSVLGAHGILPGINAERRYLSLQRTQWMMPLGTDAEKRFVLDIYSAYVTGLTNDGLLTSDQLVNDYLNSLETFAWNIRRREQGYDLIFVDELHLFGEQERLVLNYLTRSADEYPRMFMALDPRQSPAEAFAEFPVGTVSARESGQADLDLGKVDSVELHAVYRFTPEILSLVQHIHLSYPALELGPDWQFDAAAIESRAPTGARPTILTHSDRKDELDSVAGHVQALVSAAAANERVAVILVDSIEASVYAERLTHVAGLNVTLLQSRDDVDTLRYSRRSVVVGGAEHLAGLQLDHVVVAGVTNARTGTANLGYQRRRLLSLLYLAVSRASKTVEIHVNDEHGGIPDVLATALQSGIVLRGK